MIIKITLRNKQVNWVANNEQGHWHLVTKETLAFEFEDYAHAAGAIPALEEDSLALYAETGDHGWFFDTVEIAAGGC